MKWISKIKDFLAKWEQKFPDADIADSVEQHSDIGEEKLAEHCPYCNSKKFVKRGKRKKKLEVVQLYKCRQCRHTFTAQFIKGKHYPMNLIIDALSYYNLQSRLRAGRHLPDIGAEIWKAQRSVNFGIGKLANPIRPTVPLFKIKALRQKNV